MGSKFYVNFDGLDELLDKGKISQKDYNAFLYKFLVEMAERVIAQTKKKTPVDTGALRNAWAVETTKVTAKDVNLKNKKGKSVSRKSFSQEGDVVVSGEGKTLSVILANPQEYATDVEYGHRIVVGSGENKREVGWKNGVFMLTTSIEYVRAQMPLRYEAQFKVFCAQHGIKE